MDFSTIKVSTQTFIVRSNILNVNLVQLFNLTNFDKVIIGVKYKNEEKGGIKTESKKNKNFLNCVTLSIMCDKKINVKIFNNGVFQLTGCKEIKHVKTSLEIIYKLFQMHQCFTFQSDDKDLKIYIISAMRNVDFDLGFKVDRKLLGIYIDENTEYNVPPLTTGYMGVKIKIPLKNIHDLEILKISYPEKEETSITYKHYFENIEPSLKKLYKKSFISISVFQNGKVLMSGIDFQYQIPIYHWFIDLINEIKPKVCIPTIEKKSFKHLKVKNK